MDITADPIDGGCLLIVAGEIDLSNVNIFIERLFELSVDGDTKIILDLTDVEFVDSTALGTILKSAGEIESAGKRLRIVCGDGPVRRLLEMTNLTNRFQLCPTRDEALAAA